MLTVFFKPDTDVPTTDPISTRELMATVMHTLFDVGHYDWNLDSCATPPS